MLARDVLLFRGWRRSARTTSEHLQSASNVTIHQGHQLHVPQGAVDIRHAVLSPLANNAF